MKTKEDYISEYWKYIISDVSYNYYDDFGEDYEEKIDEWAESYANRRMKEQEENNKELTKYKRAFEIFKRLNGEHLSVFLGIGIISQEEYELLEELMSNER